MTKKLKPRPANDAPGNNLENGFGEIATALASPDISPAVRAVLLIGVVALCRQVLEETGLTIAEAFPAIARYVERHANGITLLLILFFKAV